MTKIKYNKDLVSLVKAGKLSRFDAKILQKMQDEREKNKSKIEGLNGKGKN